MNRPNRPCAPESAAEVPPMAPVVAGTLALMSYYARTPNLAAADKIARNLALLARHPEASAELQTVCARLFVQWLGPLQPHDIPPDAWWRDVLPEPPVAQ